MLQCVGGCKGTETRATRARRHQEGEGGKGSGRTVWRIGIHTVQIQQTVARTHDDAVAERGPRLELEGLKYVGKGLRHVELRACRLLGVMMAVSRALAYCSWTPVWG